jgi:ATP-dependent Zn protease
MTSGVHNSERTLAATAYHEAGHAVIGVLVERLPLSATIKPDGTGVVGKVVFEADAPLQARRYFDDSGIKRAYARARVLGELAGSIAHDIAEPDRKRDGADEHDDYWSRELAREMVSWEDTDAYIDAARRETFDLLRANWQAVEALAQALLEKRTMQRHEILATVCPHIKLSKCIG